MQSLLDAFSAIESIDADTFENLNQDMATIGATIEDIDIQTQDVKRQPSASPYCLAPAANVLKYVYSVTIEDRIDTMMNTNYLSTDPHLSLNIAIDLKIVFLSHIRKLTY